MNRPSEYTLERQRKQQERKHMVLIAVVLATLILTGFLHGCAAFDSPPFVLTCEAGDNSCAQMVEAHNALHSPDMERAIQHAKEWK